MATFQFLDLKSEDALHKARLFNTDEKAFRRIYQSVISDQSLLTTNGALPPPPPPPKRKLKDIRDDAADAAPARNVKTEFYSLRDNVLLEFANFEASLVRMQLLLSSNERERDRYASQKVRIQDTAQDVKHNTTELHAQLEAAQKQLALRKEYDQLAQKITGNRLLKPREDQLANIDKLNNEIAELERESREYAATWAERREQFGKIVEEGMQLRRLIRDEKEEVERREGMEGRDEQDEADAVSARGRSNVNTPRPEAGGATPLHPGTEGDASALAPEKLLSRGKSPFRISASIPEEGTPKHDAADGEAEEGVGASSPSEGLVDEDEGDHTGSRAASESGDDRGNDSMDTS